MIQMNRSGLANAAGETPPSHPEMHRRRLHRNRKYGSNDYERFDHLATSQASLGSAKFGKVRVDCRFLFTKSKWGVMGKHETPAGIVYLDLTFHEPKGCRLHSATVTVTLDDRDMELSSVIRPRSWSSMGPVQMTDCYGPKCFVGPDKSVQKKKIIRFNPSIDAAGFGGSLVDFCGESSFTSSSRWRFSSHLIPGENRDWTYESIQWELSENDIEREAAHSDTIHTAFAFQHGKQPFFMKVDVDGHLKGMRGMLQNKLSQFRASTKSDDSTAVTLISFGEEHRFTRSLDLAAKNLHFEMEQANLLSIPMVVPDPQPVTFESSKTTAPSSSHLDDMMLSSGDTSEVSTMSNKLHRPTSEREARPPHALDVPLSIEEGLEHSGPIIPALTDLARIIDYSISPVNEQRSSPRSQQQNGQVHHSESLETIQDPGDETQMNGSIHNRSRVLGHSGSAQRKPNVPGLLVLMQLLVLLRNFLDRMLVNIDTPEADSEDVPQKVKS